ncbi:MAG TPA: hypothetical protein VFM68_01650 [Candidatus Saccharimonadales bacterium]|nr:hypothetical protein [Candidatus Saccharimonadales bacterium]
MSYRGEIPSVKSHDDYLKLPKIFGAVDSYDLVAHATTHAKFESHTPSLEGKSREASIVGSALVEAAIVHHDPNHNDDDYRLGLLYDGQEALLRVEDYESDLLDHGWKNPDDQVDWRRAVLQTTFKNAYADIVIGDITLVTKSEILESIDRQLKDTEQYRRDLDQHPNTRNKKVVNRYKRDADGLVAELLLFQESWQHYKEIGDNIAIPASRRGGHGNHRPNETHDVVYLGQQPDNTFRLAGVEEIKKRRSFRKMAKHLIRYDNPIAVVGKNGSIEHIS